ncbi:hypothetical protein E2C01_039912 [Portunus trituberculatus]|uniref:Uncharacterized protein n=1 Tax=Portunus trituberculatus TaxID=210409 RepID=A0A5B7FG03_PORTR|nr:hypothetical protein [Portunus trituberculatus]
MAGVETRYTPLTDANKCHFRRFKGRREPKTVMCGDSASLTTKRRKREILEMRASHSVTLPYELAGTLHILYLIREGQVSER